MELSNLIQRTIQRLSRYSIKEHLAGLWFSRHFTEHGIIVVSGGLPFPEVAKNKGTLIAENCQFYSGVRLEIGDKAILSIGNGTYINRNTNIIARDEINIGEDCQIAWDVNIMDSNLHNLHPTEENSEPVHIADNVWIGCRSIILKGVQIGKGSVIAAGAVVTTDVPPFTVYGGVPAQKISTVDKDVITNKTF